MERFNFLKNIKLHKCCATDHVRPVMEYVHFENGYAYASDGHILVRAKVSDICNIEDTEMLAKLDGKNLHKKQFENILKFDRIEITDEAVCAVCKDYEARFKFNTDLKYPNAQKIFDDFYHSEKTPLEKIMFNPQMMKLVCEVMPLFSEGGVIFEFGAGAASPTLIRYERYSVYKDICAILMPMMINND